jgi:hypothetical protein
MVLGQERQKRWNARGCSLVALAFHLRNAGRGPSVRYALGALVFEAGSFALPRFGPGDGGLASYSLSMLRMYASAPSAVELLLCLAHARRPHTYLDAAQRVVAVAAAAASAYVVAVSWLDDRGITTRERRRQREADAFADRVPGWRADYGSITTPNVGDQKRRAAAEAAGVDMDAWRADYGIFVSEREGDRRRAAVLDRAGLGGDAKKRS